MIIKVGGLEPLGPIGVYAYAADKLRTHEFYDFKDIKFIREGLFWILSIFLSWSSLQHSRTTVRACDCISLIFKKKCAILTSEQC